MTPAALNASPRTPGCASGGSRAAICASARARGSASSMARGKQNHYARRGKPPGIGHLSGDGEELSDPLRRQCHKAAVIERRMDPTVGMVLAAAGPVNPGKAPYKFESSPLQRRVNELSDR